MATCDFGLKLRYIGRGFNSSFTLDTDSCDVESHSFIEIPVRGPDPATTLAIVSGIAVARIDNGSSQPGGETARFELFILTDYKLDDKSQFVDGSVYAWLSSISDDDFEDFTAAQLEIVEVQVNVDGRIQLHVIGSIEGDMMLDRIGYQVFVLSSKPRPLVVPARHRDLASEIAKLGRFIPSYRESGQ